MLTGIELSLLIGNPFMPEAPPPEVMEALESAQVTSSLKNNGFQLSFKIGRTSSIVTTLLPSGYFDPISTRVILSVVVSGQTHVLMDGIVTRHEIVPSNDPGKATLTITGEDLTVLMDMIEVPSRPFPGTPEWARVEAIMVPYASVGVTTWAVPAAIPTFPNPVDSIPTQQGTDLAYVTQLAQNCGYTFFVTPGPLPGTSTAYWGPDLPIPEVQRALSVNMGPETNVDALSFSLDGKAKTVTFAFVSDPVTGRGHVPVPIPNLSLLRPPLGRRLSFPSKVTFQHDTTKLSLSDAGNRILGMLFRSNTNMVSGSGSLDVLRYGDILRARRLVGVQGAGLTYDGLYYVDSVTHNLKRGEYKQSFTLSRDGLVSDTSTVPT